MKTYPLPGQTRFDSALPESLAQSIARDHYSYAEVTLCDDPITGRFHSVKSLSGNVACIGVIGGKQFILHKLPDGCRELQSI